jgi:DNA-binding response OmpR family regulator
MSPAPPAGALAPAGPRVLLVDDEPGLRRMLTDRLRAEGYRIDTAENGVSATTLARTGDYDVIVLDLGLPLKDGLEVCRELRRDGTDTPVLMLTARDAVADKVLGLKTGADDYMTKPFALQELAARLEVLARRGKGPQSRVLKVADLTYNLDTLTVSRDGKSIQLNPIGLKLLQALMEASPSVVTRQDLEQRVWGEELPDSDSLRVHIHGLRAAIDKPFDKPLIHTRHGIGYRMVEPDAVQA